MDNNQNPTDQLKTDPYVAPQPQVQPQAAPAPEKKSSSGLLPLILGIVSIVLSCTGIIGLAAGIVALITGLKSKDEDKKGLIGMICGIAGSVLSLIGMIVGIVVIVAMASAGSDYIEKASTATEWWESTTTTEDWWSTTTENGGWEPTTAGAGYDSPLLDGHTSTRQGDSVLGYISVPDTYNTFYEAGGYPDSLLDHQQFAYGAYDIITHYVASGDKLTPYDWADGVYSYALSDDGKSEGIYSADMFEATYAGYSGWQVNTIYQGDDSDVFIFIFADDYGDTQYIAVEGVNDEYYGIYDDVFDSFNMYE